MKKPVVSTEALRGSLTCREADVAIVTHLVLDVLKAHQPNALEFASQLADLGESYHVNLLVQEVDDNTQSIVLTISGDQLDFERINQQIEAMGGSVHSIDEVDVVSKNNDGETPA